MVLRPLSFSGVASALLPFPWQAWDSLLRLGNVPGWERKPSPALFPVVWGMDTLDKSHGLVEQLWESDRDEIRRRNEVSLHSMEVLQPSCGSEAGNLGFVGFRRGRRLIPGLAGADWSVTTVVRPRTRGWADGIAIPKSLVWA